MTKKKGGGKGDKGTWKKNPGKIQMTAAASAAKKRWKITDKNLSFSRIWYFLLLKKKILLNQPQSSSI